MDRSTRSLSNASSQGGRSTQSADSSSLGSSGVQSTSSSASSANTAITPPDSVVDFGTGPRRYIYVYLLTKASEYTLDTIDVSSMEARDFFQALRAIYNKHRGFWRRAFSVFVYNHCDFIKVRLKDFSASFLKIVSHQIIVIDHQTRARHIHAGRAEIRASR